MEKEKEGKRVWKKESGKNNEQENNAEVEGEKDGVEKEKKQRKTIMDKEKERKR